MLLAVLYALVFWWFTTGLIMVAYGRARWFIQLWFAGATLIMLLAMGGFVIAAGKTEPLDVYLAFTCGALIWGWHMASYYLGFVTGPAPTVNSKVSLEEITRQQTQHTRAWHQLLFPPRFRMALQAGLYHELLVLGFVVLLAALTWSQPNRWGFWIFFTLWLMHSSAKLNVFLGVRNFRVEFLPSHLHFLKRLLPNRVSNEFFPISICLATSVMLILLYQAIEPGATTMKVIGSTLVGTILFLGIIEHWLLVLPLPAILWGWGIRALPPSVKAVSSRAGSPVTSHNQNPTLCIVVEQASEG